MITGGPGLFWSHRCCNRGGNEGGEAEQFGSSERKERKVTVWHKYLPSIDEDGFDGRLGDSEFVYDRSECKGKYTSAFYLNYFQMDGIEKVSRRVQGNEMNAVRVGGIQEPLSRGMHTTVQLIN